uniref:Uncharacterized protein n=1 Tax=Palpitomonas bilix TaxID=652834 RepID=A0A7S3CYC4_9EUKA|mmetsp:Transcript_14597/g.37251  ORF Transcript_14597/g.37251 Transcript_14597/m.37251 type:complete len:432 (+) Transcript_14597:693-1988(+)
MRKKGSTSQLQKKIMDEEKKGEVERIAAEAKRKQIIDNHRKQAKGRPPSAAANHIQDVRKRINEGARREEEEIAARARKAAAEEVKKRKERERLEKEKEEKEAARIRKMKEDEEKRRKAVLERQKKMKEKSEADAVLKREEAERRKKEEMDRRKEEHEKRVMEMEKRMRQKEKEKKLLEEQEKLKRDEEARRKEEELERKKVEAARREAAIQLKKESEKREEDERKQQMKEALQKREHAAAVVSGWLWGRWRGWCARRDNAVRLKQKEAAKVLQKYFRGMIARSLARQMKSKHLGARTKTTIEEIAYKEDAGLSGERQRLSRTANQEPSPEAGRGGSARSSIDRPSSARSEQPRRIRSEERASRNKPRGEIYNTLQMNRMDGTGDETQHLPKEKQAWQEFDKLNIHGMRTTESLQSFKVKVSLCTTCSSSL